VLPEPNADLGDGSLDTHSQLHGEMPFELRDTPTLRRRITDGGLGFEELTERAKPTGAVRASRWFRGADPCLSLARADPAGANVEVGAIRSMERLIQ
jgi:hypothetical protein